MIILVTGSRHATVDDHWGVIRGALAWATGATDGKVDPDWEIWDGLCPTGVDSIAHDIGREDFGWKERRFPAVWRDCSPEPVPHCEPCTPAHRKAYRKGGGDYCPTAGKRRNELMVTTLAHAHAYADVRRKVVVAFPIPGPKPYGSSGTLDCLGRAIGAGLLTITKPLRPPAKGRTS